MLVNPFGPVHWKVLVPDSFEFELSSIVFPLQIGELLDALGAAGGFGSDKTTGPTVFDGHPFKTTYKL